MDDTQNKVKFYMLLKKNSLNPPPKKKKKSKTEPMRLVRKKASPCVQDNHKSPRVRNILRALRTTWWAQPSSLICRIPASMKGNPVWPARKVSSLWNIKNVHLRISLSSEKHIYLKLNLSCNLLIFKCLSNFWSFFSVSYQ